MKKLQKTVRWDLIFSLVAVECILIAIATIFCFPWWVALIALVTFAFAVYETIANIVRLRKASYDEAKGKKTYRYPVGKLIIGTLVLICFTAMICLALKRLFGWMLLPFVIAIIILAIIAFVKEIRSLFYICSIVAIILAVALISYGVAAIVHSGINLNPGLNTSEDANACANGHTFTEGKCSVCGAADPDYQAPCTHTFENGKCTACGAADPDYQAPVTDPCANGHNYADGKCTVCEAADPDYQAPVTDPCANGHNYADGKCTVCGTADPNYQAPGNDPQIPVVTTKINAPETMSYGKPVTVILEGINADDLKYGGEEFISIVKVSDTQVVLTLVGIVNDEGQVQIVPASGYITITDSVSGTNTSIRIVE